MWPQEGTEERLRRKQSLLYSDLRDRRHGTSGRATWERHQSGQDAGDRNKGSTLAKAFIGVSAGKTRQSRVNSLGLASLNNLVKHRAVGWSLVAWHLALVLG